MKRSYKFRLYPTKEQTDNLNLLLEQGRLLYDAALQERRDNWQFQKVSVNYYHQANQLRDIRQEDPDGLGKLNYSACQQVLRRLDKAYKSFFRRVKAGQKAGYPRFKGIGWFSSLEFRYGDGLRLENDKLYIQNVGHVRIFQHRPIPDNGVIKQAVIKRDRLDNWYVIFQIELPDVAVGDNGKPEVGIDMGLEFFASLSTGEQIDNPRWLRTSEEKLAITQRKRSRTKPGSKRNKQLRLLFAKQHQHIANQRRDFQHKLSHRLVNEFSLIAVEDLNINGLCRSHVSKSMADAAWAQFIAMLDYKACNAGSRVAEVDPWRSSQICPECGCLVQKSLSDRIHRCPHCGYTVPRDVAAAQVILTRGRARTVPPRKGYLLQQQVVGS